MLANAIADQCFNGYIVGCRRPSHGIGEVGGEINRKSGRV
jgi:hypothetical protein